MDYSAIIRKSWQIVREHRFLWWLGFLALWTEGSIGSNLTSGIDPLPSFPDSDPPANDSLAHAVSPVESGYAPPLDETFQPTQLIADWVATNTALFVVFVIAGIILYIALLYISFAARSGLIQSVDAIEHNQTVRGFKAAFRSGREHAWRLLGLNLLFVLVTLIFLTVCGFIAAIIFGVYSIVPANWVIILGVLLGSVAFVALVALAIYLSLIRPLAERSLILDNERIMAAFSQARQLIHRQFSHVILSGLISVGLSFVFGLAIVLAALVAGIGLFAIGYGFYALGGINLATWYGIVVGTSAIIVFFALSSGYTAFQLAYWTLIYRALAFIHSHKDPKTT